MKLYHDSTYNCCHVTVTNIKKFSCKIGIQKYKDGKKENSINVEYNIDGLGHVQLSSEL